MVSICVLGASTSWTPNLVSDLMATFDEPLELRFVDLKPEAAQLSAEWTEAAKKHWGRKDRVKATTDRRKALKGADAVIVTLAVGGLDAMEHDVLIPEKYGVFATVGDTAGPGGWSRTIRTVPLFRQFAEDFDRLCPTAFIANYTNPMSALTATLQLCGHNPVVGLCHAHIETKEIIQQIFGMPDLSQISLSVAGVNHFTWVVDFKIGREDGYKLLAEKIGKRTLFDVLPKPPDGDILLASTGALCSELYHAFGRVPYFGDRHTCEFLPFVLTGKPKRYTLSRGKAPTDKHDTFRYCDIKRTSMPWRREQMKERERNVREMITGEREWPGKSPESGGDMMRAYLYNKPFVDAGNGLNVGQIPGLPLGCCVETLVTVDGLGVQPVMVQNVPETLLEVFRPNAIAQKWLVDAILTGDRDLMMQALYRDPLCAHLKPHEVKQMAAELLKANKKLIPPELL